MSRILFDLFLPRGGKYVHQPTLCFGWKEMITKDRKLSVLFKEALKTSGKTVVLAHPYVCTAKLFFLEKGIVDIYLNEGINVVIFDFNGFGQSAFKDFNFDHDIDEIYNVTETLFPKSEVILHGISFGAAQSVVFMSKDKRRPKCLVLESCPANRLDYFRKRNKLLFYILKFFGLAFDSFSRSGNYLKMAIEIQKEINIRLIYGSDDQLTPLAIGKAYRDILKNQSQLIICLGGHIDILKRDYDAYKKALVS